MTRFRPCIDLHKGRVKQIVGGSLRDGAEPKTNFVADQGAGYYAALYRENGLPGGHVILLGPGNEEEAKSALRAFPGGMQIGGGINSENASGWLEAGASQVILTSWLFPDGKLNPDRIREISGKIGSEKLVVDLSCRRKDGGWNVAMNRWQTLTPEKIDEALFKTLSPYCSEFLIHAADVEGLQNGVDWDLVRHLAALTQKPVTYAGGANSLSDLDRMASESGNSIDLTIGSALDIFGGKLRFQDCVTWNQKQQTPAG